MIFIRTVRARRAPLQGEIPGAVLPPFQIRKPGAEPDLSAALTDLVCDVRDDPGQHIRSNMGLIGIQNIRIRPGLHKGLQYKTDPSLRVLYAGVQFAVRKGSRSAFSKLYVGIRGRICRHPIPVSLNRACPVLCPFPALDQNRSVSCPCKKKTAEQTSRSCSDDDDAFSVFKSDPRRFGIPVGHRADRFQIPASGMLQDAPLGLLVFQSDMYRIDIIKLRPSAGIHRLPDDLYGTWIFFSQAKHIPDHLLKVRAAAVRV